ncbi:hypothetical protein [Spiroplasma endosymbiont of Nebria brevicollis]|uniref:hypothetical protein n=1 Tax=Spiroplasma endosymbiont of Nebria brevicollis TaxID=3066284 RepID=UPI00313F272D
MYVGLKKEQENGRKIINKNQKILSAFLELQEEYVLTINDSNEKLAVANNINKIKIIWNFMIFLLLLSKNC